MKILLLVSLFTVCKLSASAQETIAVKASMNTGIGAQRGKLDNAYGMGTTVEIPTKKCKALKFTAGINAAINGIKYVPYELNYGGFYTNTSVRYTNYLVHVSGGFKYVFRDGKAWTPYAAFSGGLLSYYTEMSIEDTHDPLGCSPVVTQAVSFSIVPAGTAEAGFRIKTKRRNNGSVSYVEAGVEYLAGTRGKYIQFSNTQEHTYNEESYIAEFKQNSTGEIHDHSLGMIHRTATNQVVFHIALIFPLL